MVRDGDMVTYDTDLIGPFGYCCDISRALICGRVPPTDEQKALYRIAHAQVEHNIGLLAAGMGLDEYAAKSYVLPDDVLPNRCGVLLHGVGLCGEYPLAVHPLDRAAGKGYDGTIRAGMTLCVESYVGRAGGREGVKLEDQVLVTDTGVERLSTFPFEPDLLS